MRSRILGLALALCLLTPIYSAAQDHTDIVAAVKTRLQSQGVSLSGACGAAQITVRVAYQLRTQGYRLLVKRGGNRAIFAANGTCLTEDQSNEPGYATDYLVSLNEGGVGYDLLEDTGGSNKPHWIGPETAADMVLRNLQNNAEAPNLDPDFVPPSPTPVPPVVVPPPNATPEVVSLLQQIINLQQSQLDVILRVDATTKSTNEHVISMDRTMTQTLGHISVFLGKYVAPFIGGWYVNHLANGSKPAPATAAQ